jgi:predicted KAP-like P-loop ATPase
MYKFLKNVVALESSLMQDVIANEGVDQEMANFYAQDRNDVIRCKELFAAGKINQLNNKLNHLDTHIREGIVVAFAKDLGAEWVKNAFGYEVRV